MSKLQRQDRDRHGRRGGIWRDLSSPGGRWRQGRGVRHEPGAAEKVAAEIRANGDSAVAFKCDITSRAEVDAAVAGTEAQLGPVDVLVNNAGWDVPALRQTGAAEWNKLIAINLTGALHMLHAVLPGMSERKKGHIVNVASDAARGGSSAGGLFACKGGLVALSKTLAREHARLRHQRQRGLPGPTDTALLAGVAEGARDPAKLLEAFRSAIPMGRLGQPDDLASAIAFFASDDAGLHHRPGRQRVRRPDHARLIAVPTRQEARKSTHATQKTSCNEVRNHVAWITINRLEKMNAFRGTTCDEIIKALNKAGCDQERRLHRAGRRRRAGLLHRRRPVGPRRQLRRPRHHRPADGRAAHRHPRRAWARDRRAQGFAIGGGNVVHHLRPDDLPDKAIFGQVGLKMAWSIRATAPPSWPAWWARRRRARSGT